MSIEPGIYLIAIGALVVALVTVAIILSLRVARWRREFHQEREKRLRSEAAHEASKDGLEWARQQLKDTFDAAAREALNNNNQTFIQLAEGTLAQALKTSQHELEKRSTAVEHMIKPLSEALQKHESIVSKLGESSQKTFGTIHAFLQDLKYTHQRLSYETQQLTGALKNPKVRGRWGELGLKRAVEFAGLNHHVDFQEQATSADSEGRVIRPDMLVSLPGNKQIAIDAKMPLDAYIRAVEAEDSTQQEQWLRKFSNDFKSHIQTLGRKDYWKNLDNSIEFVVLYVELEPAFASAVEYNKDLINLAVNHNIILATPSTLIALLKSIAQNWREHEAAENARQVFNTAMDLHDRLRVFAKHLIQVGESLDQAGKSYNAAINSWDARLRPVITRMQQLGIDNPHKPLVHPHGTESGIRQSWPE